jgi:hypothetical protein
MADDIRQINDEINRLRAELGKRPLRPFDQADLERARATLTGIRAEVREMSSDLDYIAKSFKDSVNELSNQKAYLSDAKKAFNSISSISEKILDYRRGESTLNEKQLKDLQKQGRKRFEELQLIKEVVKLPPKPIKERIAREEANKKGKADNSKAVKSIKDSSTWADKTIVEGKRKFKPTEKNTLKLR